MNIFGNITSILNPVDTFLGKNEKQAITKQYIAPEVQQKPSMTLFSDEQEMFQKMKADNLDDNTAFSMLKKRRADILGGNDLGNDEKQILLKMQADNVPVKQAVAMIKKRREDLYKESTRIKDQHADEGVIEQTLKAPFRAIGDVASQTWQGIGKGTEGLIDASFRGVNDLNRMIGSSDYSPELEKQLPQGGYLGDVAKIGAGTTSAIFNLGKAPLALGINTANQLPGAQYITQGIGKGIQYGAEQLGGMAGLDKGTSMDIATTGMNLLGMKPGMNTLQYGKGIANAQGVMGKAGAIVNPVGESVVQTVKMPYDIAKGTYNLAKKLPNPLPKGADISTRANRFTAGDEGKFIAQIKETPGEFATSRGMTEVGEKAIEKAQKNFERSKAEADIGFDTIQGKFSTKGASNDIIGDLLKANKEKMNAQPRNKDSAKVDELLRKYESGEGLTMSEINEAKRIHARNHTFSYEQRTSNEARNASDIQNDIRDWQFQTAKENGFTNADKVNMETKGWKMYADSLAKKMDRSGANNAISITDWIALSGGNPTNIALFLGKKAASSNLIKTGAIKLFSKKTKPSIIEASKADIQRANFQKNVNRGVSGVGDNSGGKSLVRPVGLLQSPSGKATGAKNIRVNQPMDKTPIVNEGQVGKRPTTKPKEGVVVPKAPIVKKEPMAINNTETSQQWADRLTFKNGERKYDYYTLVRGYNDVLKNGKESGFYKNADDYIKSEMVKLITPQKTIVKPNTIKNESKVIKPSTGDTIPEGYFKNVFGEIQKLPSNKKGGFIRIGSESKKGADEAKQFYDDLVYAGNSPIVAQRETAKRFGTIRAMSASKAGTMDISKAPDALVQEAKNLATPEELLKQFTGRDNAEVNLSSLKKASPDGFSLEKISIDKLKHNIRIDDFENPTESIGKIKGIIEQYAKDGRIKPIIVDKNGNVLDGNHRINAYKALGIKEVPVYFPVLSDIKNIDNLATRLLKQNQSLDSYFSENKILNSITQRANKTKATTESAFKNNKGFINPSEIKKSLIPTKGADEARQFYDDLYGSDFGYEEVIYKPSKNK